MKRPSPTSTTYDAPHWARQPTPHFSSTSIHVVYSVARIPFQYACPDVDGVRSVVKVDCHGLHQSSNRLRSDHSGRGEGCCACCSLRSCCVLTVMPYPSHTTWPDVECKREGGCRKCKTRAGEAHSPEGGSGTCCLRSSHAKLLGVVDGRTSWCKRLTRFPINFKALCTRKVFSVPPPSSSHSLVTCTATKRLTGPTLGYGVKTEGNLKKVRSVPGSFSLGSGRP